MALLLEPFAYGYMLNAMWVSALVGGVCAFLSAYLMLKGWSLIGDALSHSIVLGFLRPWTVYDFAAANLDQYPDHRAWQYSGDNARRYSSTCDHRIRFARAAFAEMERSDGGVFR